MNTAQKQKIIEIISKDANLTDFYYLYDEVNKQDRCCVIGGLLLATGFPQEELVNASMTKIGFLAEGTTIPSSFDERMTIEKRMEIMRRELFLHYGLSVSELSSLQKINDAEMITERRRRNLIAYINSLPVAD